MVKLSKLFICAVLVALTITSSAFAQIDEQEIRARNQIIAGDYSRNIIATSGSTVLVFVDPNGQQVLRSIESVIEHVRTRERARLEDARERFPSRESEFIEKVAVAEYVFARGQYSLSASLYHDALEETDVKELGYNYLEGMVTASFYGSARHFEGLRYICEQYAFRPSWSFRFRHAIHAHVRALVAHLGHKEAERRLDAIRRDPRCRRADFTNVWIPIHLRDMREIELGVPYWGWSYGINEPEDIRYANRLLEEGGHGFTDYLLFVMGQFEEVVDQYPSSYVYDLALLGIGWKSEPTRAIAALEEYLARYDGHRSDARDLLVERAMEKGGNSLAAYYRERYPEEEKDVWSTSVREFSLPVRVSDTVRVWIENRAVKQLSLNQRKVIADYYADCPRYTEAFESGKFADLTSSLTYWRSRYEQTFEIDLDMHGFFSEDGTPEFDFRGVCIVDFSPAKIDDALAILGPASRAQNSLDASALADIGTTLKLCGDARDKQREMSNDCQSIMDSIVPRDHRISLHRAGANVLWNAFELSGRRDDRALFLSGLAYRRLGEFAPFLEAMTTYAETFADGPFADDALTEIGWFYLAIRGDTRAADRYFQRVVDEYPDENAYDNALNWLVISKRMAGDYFTALGLSVQLLGTVASDRLFPKASERHEEISIAASIIGSKPRVAIGETYNTASGFAIGEEVTIVVTHSDYSELPRGTKFYNLEGKAIDDALGFFESIRQFRSLGWQYVQVDVRLPDPEGARKQLTVPVALFAGN